MELYHGSDISNIHHLCTPTGAEVMDVTVGGVVYLTDTPEAAARYGRYVYTVEVANPVPYALQRERQGLARKKGRYTRGVYVALPRDCTIIGQSEYEQA